MGPEGYFPLNSFLSPTTNKREDEWGGSYENRNEAAVRGRRPRARGRGPASFPHIPSVDEKKKKNRLIPNGIDIRLRSSSLPSGSRPQGPIRSTTGSAGTRRVIPTIQNLCAAGGFAMVHEKLMGQVGQSRSSRSNEFNTPEVAEEVLVDGCG